MFEVACDWNFGFPDSSSTIPASGFFASLVSVSGTSASIKTISVSSATDTSVWGQNNRRIHVNSISSSAKETSSGAPISCAKKPERTVSSHFMLMEGSTVVSDRMELVMVLTASVWVLKLRAAALRAATAAAALGLFAMEAFLGIRGVAAAAVKWTVFGFLAPKRLIDLDRLPIEDGTFSLTRSGMDPSDLALGGRLAKPASSYAEIRDAVTGATAYGTAKLAILRSNDESKNGIFLSPKSWELACDETAA
ncbi:hypothetical protein OGAPHI_007327 [Ogataea philodendri]|uniref:Uncharacterized protein n=1 Tax=Ogataea philodendri TaxID=1378263 RepID=A0A9P8NUY8_9ASCO|nr:uncharacterized protein OGAPHI_007327 [Ogataea philodendri]KAH3660122.1 hypothetical protein OGAPHI_007327 [Ogataea philodendri]